MLPLLFYRSKEKLTRCCVQVINWLLFTITHAQIIISLKRSIYINRHVRRKHYRWKDACHKVRHSGGEQPYFVLVSTLTCCKGYLH